MAPKSAPAVKREYLANNGIVYTIRRGCENGDITILSDNLTAWRVKSAALTEASPVFRDMFATATSIQKEVMIPDASDTDLDMFLHNLLDHNSTVKMTFRFAQSAIALLRKYECNEAANRVLYNAVLELQPGELFTAFAAASHSGDLIIGCRVLAQGYRWYAEVDKPVEPSLAPESSQRPWKPADADKIRSSWVWALSLASRECTRRPHSEKTGASSNIHIGGML